MKQHATRAAAGLTLLGAVLLMSSNHGPFSDPQAGLSALIAFGTVGFWSLACVGLGSTLLSSSRPIHQLAAGAGGYGLLLGVLCTLFGVSELLFLLAGGAGVWVGVRNRPRSIALPPTPILVILAVVLSIGLLDALAPPVDTDEIYQHLALPHQFLLEGHLLGGELHPDASRPLPMHLLYTALLGIGGASAAKLFHLLLSGLLLIALWEMAERRVGAGTGLPSILLLIGSYSFVREMGLAYNNLPVALWCLLALDSALDDRPKPMALFSGMALAAKYTAAPVLVGIYLAWLVRKRKLDAVGIVCWTGLALLWVLPWWARNAVEGLHPLFPYAGWGLDNTPFMHVEKYGMGREPLDLLLLPWNISLHAEPDSFVFLGRVNPAGLLFLPAAAILGVRDHRALALTAVTAWVGWSLGPHWIRYLLPAAPILALLLVTGFPKLPRIARGALLFSLVLGLPQNWAPWLSDLSQRASAIGNPSAADELLKSEIRGFEAIDWVNQNSPEDARVALLFSWPKFYVDRPTVLGSVEDHVPTRAHLGLHNDSALKVLKDAEVTHLVVAGACSGCKNFLRKSYPFLSETDFDTLYRTPERTLLALLTQEATKVFESAKYSVWRLL